MRYAILSDIHGNIEALQAVLHDIESRGNVDYFWCLGDIVGYGPDPGPCIDVVRQQNALCIAGNHDLASIGQIDVGDFNSDAAVACRWTANNLSPDQTEYLANLPHSIQEGDFTLAHGSPREPIWEYILSAFSAYINFSYFDTLYCLVGHSHVPVVFKYLEGQTNCTFIEPHSGSTVNLCGERLIINPGSIGQPRDGDPRASYIIYNSDEHAIYYYRVAYNIAATQKKMTESGLPPRLISRLDHGW